MITVDSLGYGSYRFSAQDKKLDAELDKIHKVMEKRKAEGTEAPRVRYWGDAEFAQGYSACAKQFHPFILPFLYVTA